MSKCIGGVAHDAVGSLATHQPSKSFGELFEEKKAQLDTLQAGLAGAVLPKTPPMPAVKYRDSTLKGASIIILAYPYRYITRKHNVWARELDIYGRTRSEVGEAGFIPFLYQGQYLDRETGLAYNRFRYYSPETGAYISQDPIRLEAGLSNLYAYVHDVNAWVDPLGLELIPNKVAGNAREALAKKWLQKKYPNAQILSERYIRDSLGVSVKDSFGSRRRLDFVVVEDGKIRGIFKVTSPTADKTLQIRKEHYIRNNGGTAPGKNGMLYDISDIDTQRLDIDLDSQKVNSH